MIINSIDIRKESFQKLIDMIQSSTKDISLTEELHSNGHVILKNGSCIIDEYDVLKS